MIKFWSRVVEENNRLIIRLLWQNDAAINKWLTMVYRSIRVLPPSNSIKRCLYVRTLSSDLLSNYEDDHGIKNKKCFNFVEQSWCLHATSKIVRVMMYGNVALKIISAFSQKCRLLPFSAIFFDHAWSEICASRKHRKSFL